MQSVLIVVHLMIVVALVVTVLLQRSEGGALGVGGGGGFMTGRGQANVLTRATSILGALFFATSLGLTILAKYSQAPQIIPQNATSTTPAGQTQAPAPGNLLEQLKQLEEERQTPHAPAAPLAPEPPTEK